MAVISGAALPAASQLLLGDSSVPILRHLLRGHPARILPLYTTTPFCECSSPTSPCLLTSYCPPAFILLLPHPPLFPVLLHLLLLLSSWLALLLPHSPLFPALLRLLLRLPLLTRPGLSSKAQEVFLPKSLNFILFYSFLSNPSVLRSPTSALHFSGPLDTVFCDLTPRTTSLALFLPITGTLAAVLLFLSDKAHPSLNFQFFFSPRLDAYSHYVRVNILLKQLFFFLVNIYAPPICSSTVVCRTNSFSFSVIFSSRNIFILGDFTVITVFGT